MNRIIPYLCGIVFLIVLSIQAEAQNIIRGTIYDETTGDPLIGASVVIKGSTLGTVTEFDGTFSLEVSDPLPVTLLVSYVGFMETEHLVENISKQLVIKMLEDVVVTEVIEVRGHRISDKQKESPLTVESMDLIAIRETPSANFYDGLGSLKDVDLTTASLGFTIINTRGFNSTSPVRSLQIIDGVDNQSPGLNFSLGNFLGSSELDVNKVELIVGASTAYYGPNAFNGVISMETKDPFFHKGLGVKAKLGERNMFETSLRWADALNNKEGNPFMAYKLNFFRLTANDWEAENYDPVWDTDSGIDNPGGYDAVNIYGDEYQAQNDLSDSRSFPGLGTFHRTGYKEIDLVDYDSKNTKASAALHFRLQPEKDLESPELILSSSFGGGTTVYQGDNRYSLRDIKFYQHRFELKKRDKYFLRIYATHEDAGNSYDPFFTALKLQGKPKKDADWSNDYSGFWSVFIGGLGQDPSKRLTRMEGFPDIFDYIGNGSGYDSAVAGFLAMPEIRDSLLLFHSLARANANGANQIVGTNPFIEPGSADFKKEFEDITSRISFSEGGTKFYDKSALVHAQGEYHFTNLLKRDHGAWSDLDALVGGSGRIYKPNSKGSILLDTMGRNIDTYEYGFYGGLTFGFADNRLKVSSTVRVDNHENFDVLISPAASVVYNPTQNNYFRVSFSSAIRNPTLTDQYLFYNVGRAILLGNITGFEDMITVESFIDFLNTGNRDTLDFFDVPNIQPEKVKTIEFGYRTTLFDAIYVDLGYYYSSYQDFIGYQIGVDANIAPAPAPPLPTFVQAFRVSSNALDRVTTQGFSIGLNYYFQQKFLLKGNYSWNKLNTQTDDPIIPAFNTPEHKYNIGLSARDLTLNFGSFHIRNLGFNLNYKWIDGFLYEGSPQFTGFIPTYSLLDAQVNWRWEKMHTTFKLGASNILDDRHFQTYGGPEIGRLAYFSVLYDWKKK